MHKTEGKLAPVKQRRQRRQRAKGATLGFLAAAVLAAQPAACAAAEPVLQVFVSVLPQKFLARRVAGERAEVVVMVGQGQSPHTYEPTPRQMARLAGASLYFRIGVSFEDVWMERLAAANPSMVVVDCREGVDLREEDDRGHLDPHIWTSPLLALHASRRMKEALVEADPGGRELYERNYSVLAAELEGLDAEIRETLRTVRRRSFMVFHPSWGYFAEAYGLEQVAIESGGGEPGARELAGMIDRARREGIRVIFVQEQISRRSAEAVARAIGGRVVSVDPLAEDYIENLRAVARRFAEAMQ